MRKLLCTSVAIVFVLAAMAPSRADDAADARAIIDKAIKASGGEAKLAKFKGQTFNEKGTYYGMGKGLPYSGNYAFQWPDKFRLEIEDVFITVLDGDKGWIKKDGETKEMTKEQLSLEQHQQKAGWIATLLPLSDKAFQVKAIGEAKVDKQDALEVKVTRKDFPDVSLYFDKNSGLLIKSSFRTKSPEQEFKEVTQDNYYSNFRVVDGAKLPSKMVIKRDDKLFVEEEVSDYKAGKVNAKVFAKP